MASDCGLNVICHRSNKDQVTKAKSRFVSYARAEASFMETSRIDHVIFKARENRKCRNQLIADVIGHRKPSACFAKHHSHEKEGRMSRITFLLVIVYLSVTFGFPSLCDEGCVVCGRTRDKRCFEKVPEDVDEQAKICRAFGIERIEAGSLCGRCSRAVRRFKQAGTTDLKVITVLFVLLLRKLATKFPT